MEWSTAVDSYLEGVRALRSMSTYNLYRSHLGTLMKYTDAHSVPLTGFRAKDLYAIVNEGRARGLKDGSVWGLAMSVRLFVRWCHRQGYYERDPLCDVVLHAPQEPDVTVPEEDAVVAFLAAVGVYYDPKKNRTIRQAGKAELPFLRARAQAFYTLLACTGIRVSEALTLRLDDWQERRGGWGVTVTKTKGKKNRWMPVEEEVVPVIQAWLEVRPKCASRLLFVTLLGGPCSVNASAQLMQDIREHAGLARITHHSFRRYYLTQVGQSDFLAATTLSGHVDPKTTMRYARMSEQKLREAVTDVGVARRLLTNRRADARVDKEQGVKTRRPRIV